MSDEPNDDVNFTDEHRHLIGDTMIDLCKRVGADVGLTVHAALVYFAVGGIHNDISIGPEVMSTFGMANPLGLLDCSAALQHAACQAAHRQGAMGIQSVGNETLMRIGEPDAQH